MLQIAICDDDADMCRQLYQYTLRLTRKQADQVRVDIFSRGEDLLAKMPEQLDILLLDIDLGTENGVEIARQIRQTNEDVNIVFITNLPQYAVQGYKVRAFGYLLKPVSYEEFQLELHELFQRLDDVDSSQILIKSGQDLVHFSLREIYYFETQGRHLLVHTTRGCFEVGKSLGQLEKRLSPHGFLRCHTAYLVNAAHIQSLSGAEFIMNTGEHIPVSKHRRSKCLQELNRCWGEAI